MLATSIVRAIAAFLIPPLLALAPATSYGAQDAADAAPGLTLASVRIDGETLLKVRGATSLPAQVRAESIERRIKAVAEDRSIDPGSLSLKPDAEGTALYAGATRIMVVTQADAQVEQLGLPELSEIIRTRIQAAIVEYRAGRTTEHRITGALLALASTLLAAGASALLLWLIRRLRRRIHRTMRERVQTVGIQSFEILRAERLRAIVEGLLRSLTVVGLAAIGLLWLVYVLRQFPLTRGLANTLLDSVFAPLNRLVVDFFDALPSLLFLVLLYYLVRGGLRLIRAFFLAVERGGVELSGFEPEWAIPTYKIVRLVIIAIALVVAYPYIPGSDSAAFKGLSLFAGVVFSLGSSSAIANIIAGYMMTYRRAFRVGDRVKIGDAIGDVSAMRLQVTHVRTLKNEEVVIPNSQIINGHVINYSTLAKESGLLLHTTVGIGYETPWRQVEAMLLEAAGRTEGLAPSPEPFILQTALGDFAITYEINVSCNDPSRMSQIYTALHRNILDVFNEYGVAIMTPAYVADPPDAKLVPRSNWFLPPSAQEKRSGA